MKKAGFKARIKAWAQIELLLWAVVAARAGKQTGSGGHLRRAI